MTSKINLLREKEAINAYLKLLQNKGAASSLLYKRSLFLDRLAARLASKDLARESYATALKEALDTVSLIDKLDCQNTAREFYPFWMGDIKAIAAFDLHYGYEIQSINWSPLPSSLDALTKKLDREVFNKIETLALRAYAKSLQNHNADELVINTRIKMAKLILLRLKDAPIKNNKTYRMAVDMILPLFNVDKIKELFLLVVREFYYFWHNPRIQAASPSKNATAIKKSASSASYA